MSHLGILQSTVDPVCVADVEGRLVETNQGFHDVFGSNIEGRSLSEVWPETAEYWRPALAANATGKQLRVDIKAHASDGRELIFDVRFLVVSGAEPAGDLVVGVARDVTTERNHVGNLELQATVDPLTGAINRSQLKLLLAQAIRVARRRKSTGSFLYIDIDDFKDINDTNGHDEGDRVLKKVASVLRGNLRDSDVVARLGGDEFGAILNDADSTSGLAKAEQLSTALSGITVKGRDAGINVSIGLATFPINGKQKREGARGVIKRADSAMYRAKRAQAHPDGKIEVSNGE